MSTILKTLKKLEEEKSILEKKLDLKELVLQQAKLAKQAKLDAIVCSAQEVKTIRKVFFCDPLVDQLNLVINFLDP